LPRVKSPPYQGEGLYIEERKKEQITNSIMDNIKGNMRDWNMHGKSTHVQQNSIVTTDLTHKSWNDAMKGGSLEM
jgi:hypothetical protein